MTRIIAYFRPHKLEEVKNALGDRGVTGITVGDARGCGSSEEPSEWMLGKEFVVALPARVRLEAVVPSEQVEEAIQAILAAARTGRAGDGKIFLQRVEDAIRVRTGERGPSAI
jgi:nitrogen regulatory protein P-II 1